jgi:CheY-like chemotaxis protein
VIFSKLRVLIVDDDALMRTFVSGMLQRLGIHQFQEAEDGKSALVAVIKFQPNLVLSDIHMEPMNGITFVKHLRALPNPAVAAIRVILMTADTSKETLTEALPLGIRGYIIKPPTLDAMKTKIEAAMK